MVLNDVEYTTYKMFVTQMSNYLFVISFQLMFYNTLRCSLKGPRSHIVSKKLEQMACLLPGFIIMNVREGNFIKKNFTFTRRLMENNYY